VVTFAGDSIWAIWHETSVPLTERLKAATAAGLEIAKTAGDVDAERAMRFGCVIDYGHMDLWPVDDDPQAAPIICGNLPEQMVALARHMQAGHLTITASAAQVLADTITGDTRGDVVTVKNLAVPYQPYVTPIGKPLDLRIDPQLPVAASGGWIDEICRASIVFMRFPQIATDQSGAKEILGGVIAAAREITHTFGGQVVQAKVDDKGLVFLAAWGLAKSRAEDDAVRAAKAALAYQEAAQARDVATAIGIGTGRVFAGIVGDESFRTYTVLGAAVNRAAWLMEQAGEGIIADLATHQAAEAGIRFAEWGQLVFKGEETPTPVYTPQMAQTSRQTPVGRLIGRAEELSRFDAAMLSTDRPVVWISGEAGIGKSHFLHAAQSRLQAKGRTTMLGSGESLTRNQPFVAWRAILRQLLDATEAEARARLVETVRALSLPEGTADLIAPFFGLDSDTTVAPPLALDTGDAARMQEGLLAIVASRIGTADIALLFEDAHWLDTASWRLIAAVKARCPQVQVVLSNRPLDLWTLPAEARTLYTSSAACHIPLGRLSLSASRELICDVIGASTLPEELARRIQDRAEGHAYYTKELAAALLRRDSIRVRSGHCYIPNGVENLHASAFPDNIEGAIASRFTQLTPEAQLTLKVASVSGRVFDPAELAPVHPEAPDHATLAAQLDAAQRLDLIEDSPA
jgi:hypothetical protein